MAAPAKSNNRTLLVIGALVAVVATFLSLSSSSSSSKQHSHDYEDSLLSNWSTPPPWPIFIAINTLAGLLRSAANALTPPPVRMLDISLAYHTTILAYICQKYNIPDFLAFENRPKTVAEIAEHLQMTGAEEGILRVERLMYALASEGMTRLLLNAEEEEPLIVRFVNTPLSATLRTDHPNSQRGMVGHNVEDLWNVWGALPQMFGPTGMSIDSAWDVAWGDAKAKSGGYYPNAKGGIWKYFEERDMQEEQFGRAMQGVDGLGGMAMALDGPFGKFKRMIDIGGSLGHFSYKVLSNYPNLEAVLFDRPHVIQNANKLWKEEGGLFRSTDTDNNNPHERLTIVEGDFLKDGTLPAAKDGDVYFMRYILHDWTKEDCLKILRNIRNAMTSNNNNNNDENNNTKQVTLLIGECALPDRHTVGVPAVMYHIDMQMMAAFGGMAMERTPQMWKELLEEAGFELVAIHPTRSTIHFVEAIPRITTA